MRNPFEESWESASYSTQLDHSSWGKSAAFDFARQNAQRYGGTVYAIDSEGKAHFSHSYAEKARREG